MYETVLERFPRWVFGEFTGVRSVFETFLGTLIYSYVGELRKRGTGLKHKPRVQILK